MNNCKNSHDFLSRAPRRHTYREEFQEQSRPFVGVSPAHAHGHGGGVDRGLGQSNRVNVVVTLTGQRRNDERNKTTDQSSFQLKITFVCINNEYHIRRIGYSLIDRLDVYCDRIRYLLLYLLISKLYIFQFLSHLCIIYVFIMY